MKTKEIIWKYPTPKTPYILGHIIVIKDFNQSEIDADLIEDEVDKMIERGEY